MIDLQKDWEFNVLEIYNYRKPGQYDVLFKFIKDNHDKIPGDIVEAGVFRGKSIIALGMILKELGSDKRIFGFDSFSGFPTVYHPKDNLEEFDHLFQRGEITKEHISEAKKNIEWRRVVSGDKISAKNISSSGDFSGTTIDLVRRKIQLLDLDNIVLIDGPFSKTMTENCFEPATIMAVLVDCDLYESYSQALAFVWPRLSPGGLVYLDEYYSLKFPGARTATNEFLARNTAVLKMAEIKPLDFERWYLSKPILV